MAPGSHMESVMAQMGVPINYLTAADAAAGGGVVMLEAGTIWNAGDDELEKLLSGAALLTSGAARIASERGFGDLIGVKVNGHRTQGIQSEEYLADRLPGVAKIRVPHRGADWDEVEISNPQVEVASHFCDMLGGKHIGTALFKNSAGGRIAIYAQNSDMQSGLFGSHARRRWLHGVLLWLSRGQFKALPVIPQHGLSLLKQGQGQWLFAFCNLGTDVLTTFSLQWENAAAIRSILCLQKDGRWRRQKFSPVSGSGQCNLQFVLNTDLNCYEWLVLLIKESLE
jgi:hypothetical protein